MPGKIDRDLFSTGYVQQALDTRGFENLPTAVLDEFEIFIGVIRKINQVSPLLPWRTDIWPQRAFTITHEFENPRNLRLGIGQELSIIEMEKAVKVPGFQHPFFHEALPEGEVRLQESPPIIPGRLHISILDFEGIPTGDAFVRMAELNNVFSVR